MYKHCSVGPLLDKHYEKRGIFTHDLMHLAALVDTSMRNIKAAHQVEFAWLNALTQVTTESVIFFIIQCRNYGLDNNVIKSKLVGSS